MLRPSRVHGPKIFVHPEVQFSFGRCEWTFCGQFCELSKRSITQFTSSEPTRSDENRCSKHRSIPPPQKRENKFPALTEPANNAPIHQAANGPPPGAVRGRGQQGDSRLQKHLEPDACSLSARGVSLCSEPMRFGIKATAKEQFTLCLVPMKKKGLPNRTKKPGAPD